MKKKFRTVLIFMIVAVMTFGMSSVAFAADLSEKIKWTNLVGEDYDFYFSEKVLEEGENYVTVLDLKFDVASLGEDEIKGLNFVCCEFVAEQSGYYLFSTVSDTVYAVAESYDGTAAEGRCDAVRYGSEPYNSVFYIEEGTNLVGFTFLIESMIIDDVIDIEFLGSEIKDYSLSEETLDDFIIGFNVWDDNSGEIAIATNCEVDFIPEKKVELNDIVIMGTCSATPNEGKNKATVDFFGIQKEVEFTACYIDSIVESVEITNLEDHLVFTIDYNGKRHYDDVSGEVLIVNCGDGMECTTILGSGGSSEIILSNGLAVSADVGLLLNDDDSYSFVISVAEFVLAEYAVTEENKSFFGNISALSEDNFEAVSSAFDNFFVGIKSLSSDSEFSKLCFDLISEDLASIFNNFFSFIRYYMG